MEKTKRSVNLWLIAGVILSLCTLAAAVYGINNSTAVLVDSTVVIEAAEQTLECACSGDYDTLGQMLYGTPDLGACPEKSEDAESLIWYAFLDSIQYQVSEECYASGSGVALDVRVSCLDISAVTDSLQTIAPDLMIQIAEEKGSEGEIYDVERNYRESFIAEVLRSATAQVLAEQPQTMERELTLNLVRSNGGWQVVPTEALLHFLSGFVSE